MKPSHRGFTLIELLVVISIIGVLSSLVLAGLASARIKGINARIQADTISLRNEIELSYNGTSYTALGIGAKVGVTDSVGLLQTSVAPYPPLSTKIKAIIADILAQNPGAGLGTGAIYGGGAFSTWDCGSGNVPVTYKANYNYSGTGIVGGPSSNGLTIFVYPSCGPVTKYAIYSSWAPMANPSGASAGAYVGSGYFCIDSSGRAISTAVEGIRGNDINSAIAPGPEEGQCQ